MILLIDDAMTIIESMEVLRTELFNNSETLLLPVALRTTKEKVTNES